ncbi:MAG: acetyl-CoA carboxylase biotin carboxyl carrier protein subunit [Rhodothermales bacterium]|nr:acetyl-CoA carboxylase biotin carboxyl carrier protein subunit [Rhodothermales bacterium]MBO6781387.1 acetyl-CoA carboxylase biotin carboxyl carrier protein subunit [Rhodothermales bacterium]
MALETYHIDVEGDTHTLDADGKRVVRDNVPLPLTVTPVGPDRFAVLLDGSSVVVTIEERLPDGLIVRTPAGRREIRWKDRRALLLESMGFENSQGAAEREVRAPMPGLVLKVLVEPGTEVSAGDGLVVLEAMKMENELRAASAGTVESVSVVPGDAVGKDALLIRLAS